MQNLFHLPIFFIKIIKTTHDDSCQIQCYWMVNTIFLNLQPQTHKLVYIGSSSSKPYK